MIQTERFEHYGIMGVNYSRSGDQMVYCPKCHPERKKRRVKELSVNVGKGLFKCHHCTFQGSLRKVDTRKAEQQYEKPQLARQKTPTEKAMQWLRSRGLSEAVVLRNQVAIEPDQKDPNNVWICFNYLDGTEIVNVKMRSGGKEFRQSAGGKRTLYKVNDIAGKEEIILTEGEIDALSFEEAGLIHAASLPDGAVAPGQDATGKLKCLDIAADALAHAKVFYLAMDADAPGEAMREELARRLGRHRCRIVRYPEGCKDANDVLRYHGRKALQQCIEQAAPYPIQDVLMAYDFADGYFDIYNHGHAQGVTTGVLSDLDQHVSFHPGSFIVVTGRPNHGKSPVVDEIKLLLAAKHGWTIAEFNPEMYPPKLHASMLASQAVGKPFLPNRNGRMTMAEAQAALDWINDHFFYIYPHDTTFSIDEVLDRAAQLVQRVGIKLLCIDNWAKLDHQQGKMETETQYVSLAIDKMILFGQRYGVVVILVAHPTKAPKQFGKSGPWIPTLDDISGSSHFRNKAYIGMCVFRNISVDGETGKVVEHGTEIHVQKVRFNWVGKLGAVKLRYEPANGRYVPFDWTDEQARKPWIPLPEPAATHNTHHQTPPPKPVPVAPEEGLPEETDIPF